MPLLPIAYRYIFQELLTPFGINLVFFSFVFLIAQLLKITDLIVNYGVRLSDMLMMLLFMLPDFLVYVIPMSVMIAILLTCLRMSSDNEILAFKSAGVGVHQLLPAFLFFALIGSVLTGYIVIYAKPVGRLAVKRLMMDVAFAHTNVGIKERVFNDRFKDVVLYVNRFHPQENRMEDVFIADQRETGQMINIVAPRGELISSQSDLTFILRLFDGIISQADVKKRTTQNIHFDSYVLKLEPESDLRDLVDAGKDEEEMRLGELYAYLQTVEKGTKLYYEAQIEFHRKFSLSVACLFLGFLAIPLGVQSKGARTSYGLLIGFATFLLYYVLQTVGIVFGETGQLPAVIGMWLPNGIMGCIGGYLFYRVHTETPFHFPPLRRWVGRMRRAIRRGPPR